MTGQCSTDTIDASCAIYSLLLDVHAGPAGMVIVSIPKRKVQSIYCRRSLDRTEGLSIICTDVSPCDCEWDLLAYI